MSVAELEELCVRLRNEKPLYVETVCPCPNPNGHYVAHAVLPRQTNNALLCFQGQHCASAETAKESTAKEALDFLLKEKPYDANRQ